MSSDDKKIPVATVAAEDEDGRDLHVPEKLSTVTMTAWKRDFGGKAYHFTSEDDAYATSVP